MKINIVIKSYKRAGIVAGYDYFKTALLCIPESQRDDYFKHYGGNRLLVIDDQFDGVYTRKMNWILRNVERPLLMMDDDISCLMHTQGGPPKRRKARERIRLTQQEAEQLIINGFNLAHDWNCVLWGLNVNTDGRNYQQYKPFSLTQPVLGPFQAHLWHDLYYDERLNFKEDYDFSLQVLNKHRKILRLNKYAYDCKHADNKGGAVSQRTMELETEAAKRIMRKWGTRIIKYRIPPRKMVDILNGRVNVPIKGV